jgi:Antitoxin FitA-like, ribbon-helix-helix
MAMDAPSLPVSQAIAVSVVTMSQPVNPGDETGKVPSVLIRDIDDELHRRLRVAAAYEGESFSDLGKRAIKAEVERIEAKMERERRGKG